MKYLFTKLFIFLSSSLTLLAENYEPKDVIELQAQYNLLIDLRNEENISKEIFEEKTAYLKELAIYSRKGAAWLLGINYFVGTYCLFLNFN